MLEGQVFKGQTFENQVFAVFINTFLDGHNGIIKNYKNSMKVTAGNNSVTINSGAICIQGRFLEEDTETTINVASNTAFCKLIIEIDLDKENTDTEFKQGYYRILTSSTKYPDLTQNDIANNNAGVYQYELARFKTSINGISDFVEAKQYLNYSSLYALVEEAIQNIENGSAYATKSETMPIGAGCDYYGKTAPTNFLFADGRAISRTEYAELFKIIGTTYGAGDGLTTFNLPDKRERVSIMASSNYPLGTKSGSKEVTPTGTISETKLSIEQIPSHNHGKVTLSGTLNFAGEIVRNVGTNLIYATSGIIKKVLTPTHAGNTSVGTTYGEHYDSFLLDASHQHESVGGGKGHTHGFTGKAHTNMQPFFACNYIIRVK